MVFVDFRFLTVFFMKGSFIIYGGDRRDSNPLNQGPQPCASNHFGLGRQKNEERSPAILKRRVSLHLIRPPRFLFFRPYCFQILSLNPTSRDGYPSLA